MSLQVHRGCGRGLALPSSLAWSEQGKVRAAGHLNQAGAGDPTVLSAPRDGDPSMHFSTSCHTMGSCLTSGLQLGVQWLPGNFVVTTEKIYLNLKQPDMEDSKEKASEQGLSTESPEGCGRAENHGTPKQRLPESVCINSPGGLLKDTWPRLTQRFSLSSSGGP